MWTVARDRESTGDRPSRAPDAAGAERMDAVLMITERYLRAAASPSVAQHAFAVLRAEAATTALELRPFSWPATGSRVTYCS